jgi:2-isopropylmalate synthase
MVADIRPIAEIQQRTGVPIECGAFIGSSPVRQYAEGWTLDFLEKATNDALAFAAKEGVDVMYVTEDTTRADPESLRRLFTAAIRAGAKRLCVADTVGHATPSGARALVTFVKSLIAELGADVGIDWHGHRDRGFGVASSIAALEAGATRLHGAALGIGERCGNTPIDLLMVNLVMMGYRDNDLTGLPAYVQAVSKACDVRIAPNYPVLGADAFRTATGVHAAAVVKAFRMGDRALMDAVYAAVPASLVGRQQEIEVGRCRAARTSSGSEARVAGDRRDRRSASSRRRRDVEPDADARGRCRARHRHRSDDQAEGPEPEPNAATDFDPRPPRHRA